MSQKELLELALQVAKDHNYKGAILATSDGNVFLGSGPGQRNMVVNHAKTLKKGSEEPTIYMIDTISKEIIGVTLGNFIAGTFKPTEETGSGSTQEPNTYEDIVKAIADGSDVAEMDLSILTVAELKALCASLEIETKATKKADLIDAIKSPSAKVNQDNGKDGGQGAEAGGRAGTGGDDKGDGSGSQDNK